LGGRDYLFKREHHNRIAMVLQSLDAELLQKNSCLFGGGTAIVLAQGEYRESADVDFLISNRHGYQLLRSLLTEKGINSITRPGMSLSVAQEIRADQYGIRTMLLVGDTEIKFEIIFEARIQLDPPNENEKICGVSTLTLLDMAATKLLANSDRWADSSVHSRDLIDLAMLGLDRETLREAIQKAETAYGESVLRDLKKAVTSLSQHKGRLEACMDALKIDTVPKAQLWQKIRNLIK